MKKTWAERIVASSDRMKARTEAMAQKRAASKPHLFKRIPRAAWIVIIVFAVGLFGLCLIVMLAPPTPQEVQQAKQEAQRDAQQQAQQAQEAREAQQENASEIEAQHAMHALKNASRNPDSFKMEKAYLMSDGALCFQYRGENGFGGMSRGVAMSIGGVLLTPGSAHFNKLWRKECDDGTHKRDESGLFTGWF